MVKINIFFKYYVKYLLTCSHIFMHSQIVVKFNIFFEYCMKCYSHIFNVFTKQWLKLTIICEICVNNINIFFIYSKNHGQNLDTFQILCEIFNIGENFQVYFIHLLKYERIFSTFFKY